MEKKEEEEIVIVGAGIAGLATALALKRVGLKSRVLERHSELRTTGGALSLFHNAWFALGALGVDQKLTSIYKRPNNDEVGTRTVHRKALLQAIAEELPSDTIRFSSKLISIRTETTQDSSKISTLLLDDGTIIKAKVVIGCDGIHSIVAEWLGLARPIDSGRAAFRGLAVFPESHGLEMGQYVGHGIRGAFIPLNSKELHWFLLHYSSSLRKDIPTSPAQIQKEVIENLSEDFPSDFLSVIQNTDPSTMTWAPLLFRAPWNIAFGRIQNGNITVAGDAMHPMTPELGQGGCSALEDAVILARCLSRSRDATTNGENWPEEGLKRYVEERRWRVARLVAGSWFAGWVQQAASCDEWWSLPARLFRDHIFHKFVFPWIIDYSHLFNCGELALSEQ